MSNPSPWPALWVSTLTCSLAGLGVSVYLTYAHYTAEDVLACPDTGVVNCAKVVTSPQSVQFGVPVALLGLFYFVVMLVLTTPWLWAASSVPLRMARVAAATVGVVSVVYLVYVELFVVDSICLYCTAVHVVTLTLFALILAGTFGGQPAEGRQ